jgi:hypothetical protein
MPGDKGWEHERTWGRLLQRFPWAVAMIRIRHAGRVIGVLSALCRIPLGIRGARRKQRLRLVLRTLANGPELVADLARSTRLGPAVLPLLAELKRDGLVEQGWTTPRGDAQLTYWLTPKGREHMERS